MGDQLRLGADGPRDLDEDDYRTEVDTRKAKPKIVRNDPSALITAPAQFDPLVDRDRHERLLAELEKLGGTQRGKPRSRDPHKNPLGGHVFDMNCSWPTRALRLCGVW